MSTPLPFTSFRHGHDGERLSGVYGGDGTDSAAPTAVLLHGAGSGGKERLLPLLGEFVAQGWLTGWACGSVTTRMTGRRS
ncbi:hypothetical protein [Streptomyces sp.]|uniref:hypothetical protein n=1 Tax=Streptomyces sp. TaxID=1931 RepID=UPI0039C9AF8B